MKLERFFEANASRITVSADVLDIIGDWAVKRGEFEQSVVPRDGGATATLRRRYLEVWKKQDGAWRAFWGIDGPVAEETADP